MLITLALDTQFFADQTFRQLIERFLQSEITHTEVANSLNQKPADISAILGAVFIVALKAENSLTRLSIFPELSAASSLDIEKAHLMTAGIPEDIADSLLVIMYESPLSGLRSELSASAQNQVG